MNPMNSQTSNVVHDEDVKFEFEKEPELTTPADIFGKARPVGETIIPAKEDTLGNSDFPPLTDGDKKPKLTEK